MPSPDEIASRDFCAHRFASILIDPEGPFFNRGERKSFYDDLRIVDDELWYQGIGVSERLPNILLDPLPDSAGKMMEDWLLAVMEKANVDVTAWVNRFPGNENDCEFVSEFASYLRLLIKPHEPDWQ